ncbi:MAG: hypothetical protein RL688_586, partial [Actinomycetota bacterium]
GGAMGESLIRFDGRVAIVTGAGRGLGREHALLLASRGAQVVVNDVSAEHAVKTAEDIMKQGGHAVADTNSVSDPEAAAAIVIRALETFGGLHIVINNAGRGGPTGTIEETSDAQVATIISSHLIGSYNVSRAAWGHLREQNYGRILMTSSSAAIGSLGMPAYSMAKAGLIGLAHRLHPFGGSEPQRRHSAVDGGKLCPTDVLASSDLAGPRRCCLLRRDFHHWGGSSCPDFHTWSTWMVWRTRDFLGIAPRSLAERD